MNMKIDASVATKVLATVRQGLVNGLGRQEPGQMCVEAAVCYALGLPHSDDPKCVSQALRSFKISLNDSNWSSPQARAKGLERLAVAQLGSIENFNETDFAKRLSLKAKDWADEAKKLADAMPPGSTYATDASSAAWSARSASAARSAAASAAEWSESAAAWSAWSARSARSAAWSAAWSARSASAARSAAESAAMAARSAAMAAARSAAARSALAAAESAAHDAFLAKCAEDCVQVLIEMNAPGVQWLSLTEAPQP